MEHRKLANGSGHKLPIGHSPSPAPRDQMDAARSAGEKTVLRKNYRPDWKCTKLLPIRKRRPKTGTIGP